MIEIRWGCFFVCQMKHVESKIQFGRGSAFCLKSWTFELGTWMVVYCARFIKSWDSWSQENGKNKRKTMNFPTINHPKNFGWNIKTNLIKLVLIAILRCYSQGYSRTSSNSLLAQTIVRVPNRMVEKKGLEKRTMHGIAYFMQIDSIR